MGYRYLSSIGTNGFARVQSLNLPPDPPFGPTHTKNNRVLPMTGIYHPVQRNSDISNRSRVIAWKPFFSYRARACEKFNPPP